MLVRTGLLAAALALGFALALGVHLVADRDTATSAQPANVRGALARALANQGGASDAAPSPAGAEPIATAEPPSAPASDPAEAVRRFLEFEVAGDHDGSYGLLSAADRVREASRAEWSIDHAELPTVTGYTIGAIQDRGDRADVAARLTLRADVTATAGVVPGRADATFTAVAEDGGWRVAFADTRLVPRYPSPARAPAAVAAWASTRSRCRTAPELVDGLLGAAARADALCGARGPIRTGRARALPESAQDQPFLAAFGSAVHDWARVVRVEAPVRMDVVVAPLGERWLVVGVLQEPSERS